MKLILGFQLYLYETTLKLPEGSKILNVEQIQEEIHIWFEADSSEPLQERSFVIYQTGQELISYTNIKQVFIGSFVFSHGEDIIPYHIYEKIFI